MKPAPANFYWKLATILAVSFACRVIYVQQAEYLNPRFSNPGSDARYYTQLARAMKDGTTMGNPKPKTIPPGADLQQCRSAKCRRWIFWIVVDGNRLPVDPVRVGTLAQREPGSYGGVTGGEWFKNPPGFVPHHRTCPGVGDFRKGGGR